MKKFAILPIILVLLTSCEKVVEFNAEEIDPFVVAISDIHSGSPVKVRLTMSRFFLSNTICPAIDNAVVYLDVNGVPSLMTAKGSQGIYSSTYAPQAGDTLTLRASIPGQGSIEAGTRVPVLPQISDIKVLKYDSTNSYNQRVNLSFILHDDGSQRNYYKLEVIGRHGDGWVEHYDYAINDRLIVNPDMVETLLEDNLEGYETDELLFDDANINGTDHQIKLQFSFWSVYDEDLESPDIHIPDINIRLTTFSREMYYYIKTKNVADYGEGVDGLFGEPVQIYTNVQGGIGIFGASNTKEYPFNPRGAKQNR